MIASEHQALYAVACVATAFLVGLAAFVHAGLDHRRRP